MKSKYSLIVVVMLSMIISGCYYDVQEELYPGTACDTTISTYSAKIQPLISGTCAVAGCHIANGQSPDLSVYQNVKDNIDRIQVRALVEKTMPPSGPLSDCDIQVLQQWIDNGSLNN